MSAIDKISRSLEYLRPQILKLGEGSVWLCILDKEGYETFTDVTYDSKNRPTASATTLPAEPEVSTAQLWDGDKRQTFVPISRTKTGRLRYALVEEILETGEVPEFTAESIAQRIVRHPYNRDEPASAIHPLLRLPPFTDQSSPQAT